MRSDELVTRARQSAGMGDGTAFPDYTDQVVLDALNDKFPATFADKILKARAGYWLKEFTYTTTIGLSRYRIPPRSLLGGLEKVELATVSTGPFVKLDEIPASVAQDYRATVGSQSRPYVYTVRGDLIDLIPTPNAALLLKLSYYLRPSRLQTQQSFPLSSGSTRGIVQGINTGARTVTVNQIPFDMTLTVPAAITSGVQKIDIVHPDGWHELSYVDGTQTIAGVIITLTDSQDMADIQLGDFVRAADQTDWPCLPDEAGRLLADATAVKLMGELQLDSTYIAETNGGDLLRFASDLLPRVKAEPKTIGIMRRSRGYGYPFWRLP